jgi:hypothetical protein
MAIVAVVVAAGLRLRSGQSPQQVRDWLVRELEDLGIANAASLAVEVMTGVVVFRPVTALAAKWGMARVRTARATSATLNLLRERLQAEVPLTTPSPRPPSAGSQGSSERCGPTITRRFD